MTLKRRPLVGSRKKGNHATFDVTAAKPIRAQRLRAVASTPISEVQHP